MHRFLPLSEAAHVLCLACILLSAFLIMTVIFLHSVAAGRVEQPYPFTWDPGLQANKTRMEWSWARFDLS